MSRRAEIHANARNKARIEAELASGERKIVRPPSPASVPPGAVKIHGNQTTMGFGNILFTNTMNSLYLMNDCSKIESFQALVDEIYNKVEHVQPFISNTANQVSSAFCLLYALYCLRPTKKQVRHMLDHPDSPYIRAIGFLFLRYATNPKELLDWCWDYIHDDEPITLRERGQEETTIGKFVRMILTDLAFLGTRLPRIPVMTEKMIKEELAKNPYAPASHGEDGEQEIGHDAGHAASAVARDTDFRNGHSASADRDRRDYRREGDLDRDREYHRDRDYRRQDDFRRDHDRSRRDHDRRDRDRRDYDRRDYDRRDYDRRDRDRRDYDRRDRDRRDYDRRDDHRDDRRDRDRRDYDRHERDRRSRSRSRDRERRSRSRSRDRERRGRSRSRGRD